MIVSGTKAWQTFSRSKTNFQRLALNSAKSKAYAMLLRFWIIKRTNNNTKKKNCAQLAISSLQFPICIHKRSSQSATHIVSPYTRDNTTIFHPDRPRKAIEMNTEHDVALTPFSVDARNCALLLGSFSSIKSLSMPVWCVIFCSEMCPAFFFFVGVLGCSRWYTIRLIPFAKKRLFAG